MIALRLGARRPIFPPTHEGTTGAAVLGNGVLVLPASSFATTTGRWIDVGGDLALCIAEWALYRNRPKREAAQLATKDEMLT